MSGRNGGQFRQEPARTVDALVERIGSLLDRFLPNECANFFHDPDYHGRRESALSDTIGIDHDDVAKKTAQTAAGSQSHTAL
ncbi:hypothetical protein HNO88_004366 [Novosphingobium chloroacetimidivorans]|uniref:Transposase n=1 Tax=Novosphingobium chloroacetimidivorans TaxID=1428314 RepID=A0A7W7KFB4_9SPHN|nr:hypothetical protein [Novosphingobium chloroacetimidivorans]MBB4861018.1 hypothetical protein [Novosphingobium chloroacetimidivorans]